jgi:hypothetical protein
MSVDLSWMDRIACAGMDPALFFAHAHTEKSDAAKLICDRCPVREQCEAWGGDATVGLWGGRTPAERKEKGVSKKPFRIEGQEERFWAKVAKADGCWLWTGAKDTSGYGNFQGIGAHRIAYQLTVGPIPEGLTIDHLCRVRACVNPVHMEPVTRKENTWRGEGRAGKEHRQTECIHGHPFDEANTIHRACGRRCRTCEMLRSERRSAERRAALGGETRKRKPAAPKPAMSAPKRKPRPNVAVDIVDGPNGIELVPRPTRNERGAA